MPRIFLCAIPLCFGGALAWAGQATRPDLTGVWLLDTSKSEIHSHLPAETTWTIRQAGDTIHLQDHAASFDCTTLGKDCAAKSDGKPAKISFWYNGPALVEIETLGHNGESVTKKRMNLSGDGSTLTVEVIHLLPDAPPEKWVLTKQVTSANAKH